MTEVTGGVGRRYSKGSSSAATNVPTFLGGTGILSGNGEIIRAGEVVPHGGIRGMNWDMRSGNLLLSTQPGLLEVGRATIDCTLTDYQRIALISDVDEVTIKYFSFQRFSKTPDATFALGIFASDEVNADNVILANGTGFNASVGTFGIIEKQVTPPQLRRLVDFYAKVGTANATALTMEVVAYGAPKWAKNYAS